MHEAKFVQVNGRMFITGYTSLPDDSLVADDIVLEATSADSEFELTFEDVRDADQIGRACTACAPAQSSASSIQPPYTDCGNARGSISLHLL
jgi:hypothetical protein